MDILIFFLLRANTNSALILKGLETDLIFVSMFDNHYAKTTMLLFGLILVSISSWNIQWFCLLSVILVLWYNGKRGKYKLKYLFYLYYPLHIAVLYLLAFVI